MIVNLKPTKIQTAKIAKFERDFDSIIYKSQTAISQKLAMNPPDITVEFHLVDMAGIPMVEMTGYTSPDGRIEISLHAVDSDFHGYTSTQKVVTHELVHSYFMHYGRAYASKPLWLKEGIALWTAGQTYDADFSKVPEDIRNGRWAEYLSYIEQFQAYLNQGYTPIDLRDMLLQG